MFLLMLLQSVERHRKFFCLQFALILNLAQTKSPHTVLEFKEMSPICNSRV